MKILLVEDEEKISSFVKKGLESQGYEVSAAFDGQMGKRFAFNNLYDVILLDANLPHINGFELCRLIRQEGITTPIMMLTALDSVDDKLEGFDAGADDYLSKPFEFRELIARVRALTKRSLDTPRNGNILKLADLEMNLDEKSVKRMDKHISLTAKEFSLLEYLLINKGRVISKVDIAEKVWDLNFDTGTNIIEVYVNFLRKKIDKDFDHKLIHTVVGMGYVMREQE